MKAKTSGGCRPGDPKGALNYSFGTFLYKRVEEVNFLSSSGKRNVSLGTDELWVQNTRSLVGWHESDRVFMGSTVMLGPMLGLLSQIANQIEGNCPSVAQCRCPSSLAASTKEKYLFSHENLLFFFSGRNVNTKEGSDPNNRLCLFSYNDAGGILNRAFKPGKSIKLSVVAKSLEGAVHI